MEKIKEFLTSEFYLKNKSLILPFIFIVIIVMIRSFIVSDTKSSEPNPTEVTENFSTFIPKGYSLVPIDVENYKSLDSVLGQFGTVDVFTKNTIKNSQRLVKLASNVKALRSQLEPSTIGLLVPSEAVSLLLSQNGGIYLALSSNNNNGTVIEKSFKKFSNRKFILSN